MMMTMVAMTTVTMMTTVPAQHSFHVQHAQPHSRHLNILPSLVVEACILVGGRSLVSWLAGPHLLGAVASSSSVPPLRSGRSEKQQYQPDSSTETNSAEPTLSSRHKHQQAKLHNLVA